MSTAERFDAIVIGTGQGGGPLSGSMADAAWNVAVIEREHVGGTCINVGCSPTKTMVASARVAYLAQRAADYGVNTGSITIDQKVVRQRKQNIVDSFSNGSRNALLRRETLELIMGEGSFTSPNEVTVELLDGGVRALTAEKIFVNTGARPAIPQIEGLEQVPYLTSSTIMELDSVPEHLMVLGGGYIGMEFGQMFRRFGAEVTIVERKARMMPREDPDVCGEAAKIFEEDGITLRLGLEPTRVALEGGQIQVSLGADQAEVITGSHLLVATGRTPNSDALNLEAAGLETDERGFIQVNDRFETGVPGVYAFGDVTGPPMFTHIAYDHYRILRANLLEGGDDSNTGRQVPYTVFIDPQLARVGLSEEEAGKAGLNYKVATMPMAHVARAIEVDETRGMMKAIVDADTQQILGCAVLGIEGGEIMSMMQIAMMGRIPYPVLQNAIFAHPTLAESLNNLFGKIAD